MKSEEISRRSFLKRALALSAVSAIPSFWTPAHGRVLPTSPLISANDRVNIARSSASDNEGARSPRNCITQVCVTW